MYTSPDFIKVNINVNESFAAYGCPMDEFGGWQLTVPCDNDPNRIYVTNTLVSLGLAHQCYTTLNAG